MYQASTLPLSYFPSPLSVGQNLVIYPSMARSLNILASPSQVLGAGMHHQINLGAPDGVGDGLMG